MSNEKSPWYKPNIGPRLKPMIRRVCETWAGIVGKELETHLHCIRDQAWPLGEYPCIGEWMFLLPSISIFPDSVDIIDRVRVGATVLDVGCCFGQNLRLIAAEGVSTKKMYATNINAELWDLGFELFRDRDKMKAKFIHSDILGKGTNLQLLNRQIDIIIACQFLHLFDWNWQLAAMKRVMEFSRHRSVFIGYQRVQVQAQEVSRPWGTIYYCWFHRGDHRNTVSIAMVDGCS
ncbi:MAG: hypothetical protein MMC33_006345 [Icmadophila ericetorum]|nr:hypothetical protein [Icmadophila ericetorum]